MLPVFLWDDVAYVNYNTSGRVSSAHEYGRDVYSNTLDLLFFQWNVMWRNCLLCTR